MTAHVEPRLVRRRGALLAASLGIVALAGCGSGGSDGGEVFDTAATVPSTAVTTTVATTTTAVTTTTQAPGAEQWIGTIWTADAEDPQQVVVDGERVGLTSVSGLCTDQTCERASDLLTASASSGGAPTPGAYLLFASEVAERGSDGAVTWQVTDALDVEIAEGETPILCSPVADPALLAQGIAAGDLPLGGSVVPERVWVVDGSGAITTPDPAGYRCEVGDV